MRKFISVLCLLAILCVAYLAFTQPQGSKKPAMKDIESGADELVDQMKGMYEEYGSAAVAQADETLGDAVEKADEKLGDVVEKADEKLGDVVTQADEAIEEAVESAVEGAKEGFFESMKESIGDFFQSLTSRGDENE